MAGWARFSRKDLSRLLVHRGQFLGATDDTALLAVSRVPTEMDGVRMFGPYELDAWR